MQVERYTNNTITKVSIKVFHHKIKLAETQGGGAMIRRLLCKHQDLNPSPSSHVKRLDVVVCAFNTSAWAAQTGRSLELIGQLT